MSHTDRASDSERRARLYVMITEVAGGALAEHRQHDIVDGTAEDGPNRPDIRKRRAQPSQLPLLAYQAGVPWRRRDRSCHLSGQAGKRAGIRSEVLDQRPKVRRLSSQAANRVDLLLRAVERDVN